MTEEEEDKRITRKDIDYLTYAKRLAKQEIGYAPAEYIAFVQGFMSATKVLTEGFNREENIRFIVKDITIVFRRRPIASKRIILSHPVETDLREGLYGHFLADLLGADSVIVRGERIREGKRTKWRKRNVLKDSRSLNPELIREQNFLKE